MLYGAVGLTNTRQFAGFPGRSSIAHWVGKRVWMWKTTPSKKRAVGVPPHASNLLPLKMRWPYHVF